MKNIIIRVGEKNNFNQTIEEFEALKPYEKKGKIFVNSNGFTKISSQYPSIVTINPYMNHLDLKGDLSQVKAVRLKIFRSDIQYYRSEIIKSIDFCIENDLKILLTFMRYKSIKTAEKYSGKGFRALGYVRSGGYFRPTKETKKFLKDYVTAGLELYGKNPEKYLFICDESGHGCPSCMNCSFLTYGTKKVTIKALNLSISGVKDKYGNLGRCQYSCPDCFAKLVTFGRRPQCDKLISNKKIDGMVDNQ